MPIEWPSILNSLSPTETTMEGEVPIPEPPALPFIGHLTELDRELPIRAFASLADRYGEIYRLRLPGRTIVFVTSHRLVDELCDEKKFVKIPKAALHEIRNGVHDGLFTARLEEPNWGIAHRVLMPAFGPISIRGMFEEMHEIATQLAMKWARYGPRNPIEVSEDFTRLALDTLALCSMGYRFNSYYTSELHPFIAAMGDFLTESGNRPNRTMPSWFYRNEDAKYWKDINVLRDTSDEVLQERKRNPSDRKDLLNAMLNGVDPKTGQHMSDSSITDNLITFLVAGHETTSGLLSFVFYELLKNPDVYRKAQQEVDTVIGKGPITVDHMSKLPYIVGLMRETLRFHSPISQIGVTAKEDTLLGGKYLIHKGETASMLFVKMHQDPAVYGDDAQEFKPERMLDEPFNKLPKNAWKPFGNGLRACIGRPFAWQEATLAIAMLLQNFNFIFDDPSYSLALKQTLTIKPKGFRMRATLRDGMTPSQLEHRLAGKEPPTEALNGLSLKDSATNGNASGKPITILYGSNSGTCESLAQRVASDALRHGYKVSKVDFLDTANGNLPKGEPVVIVTASYEGQPPDNAAHFVSWIESIEDKTALEGVHYTVFGVGHHDWAQTFHRIPKLVDTKLTEAGATRVADIGLTDVGKGDAFADFETWEDEVFWPSLKKKYGTSSDATDPSQAVGLRVSVTNPRTSTLRQDVMEGLVVESRTLTVEGEPVKKHIEIVLPSDESYRAGDYLAILPINPKQIVERAMRRFHLPWDAHITIGSDGMTSLPTNTSLPAHSVFSAYVELSQPATKRNIGTLVEAAMDADEKEALRKYANEAYEEVASKRLSVLDLLEKHVSVDLPLGAFLAMLPPMRVRQYSISSSPLWNPLHVTLTFSVLEAPSKSGQGVHVGVASSYLASLAPGDKLHVSVRPSHAAFHLPQDIENVPVICVAAGTGLAPFRGFIQERAAMVAAGRKLAPALLFIGSREPGRDDLYAEELAEWEKAGAISVRRAYSRKPEASNGNKYVQDALRAAGDEVTKLWSEGAKLYVCGSRAVGEGVKAAVVDLVKEVELTKGREVTEEQASKWWEGLRNTRYATDVFD
ncbi:cytochrome P450 [Hypoxylon trugodes]|uniref:cytochrome P450 n=1 Tax=Hypoxylon trugodes TaxID=326681 RepID=UPI002197BB18|nr:cytochrome P450 [Hypoxylon trugodes]KAI1389181.1 cytochrome P450 [Hypoxylon trugodes]